MGITEQISVEKCTILDRALLTKSIYALKSLKNKMNEFIQSYNNGIFKINDRDIEKTIVLFNRTISKSPSPKNVQLNHIASLIEKNPSYLIIGTGPFGQAKLSGELEDFIKRKGIRLIVKPTRDACRQYNELLKDGRIVAGFLINKL